MSMTGSANESHGLLTFSRILRGGTNRDRKGTPNCMGETRSTERQQPQQPARKKTKAKRETPTTTTSRIDCGIPVHRADVLHSSVRQQVLDDLRAWVDIGFCVIIERGCLPYDGKPARFSIWESEEAREMLSLH